MSSCMMTNAPQSQLLVQRNGTDKHQRVVCVNLKNGTLS